ncbi:purine-nucleoside phosphorylase [Salinimicrobium tongyeongense]|jgi:purine-nucleoside phosphorylase|uniref:Purine nucleoside phosphorylase n=1 Tax=Salinimicrobium tongyeongense TaxID=2809707 RepID=A0ABY6NMT3_9FLAO|nr:purine-nucleoside phosphorylase [Salinimicrobium tongyeongense]UZH54197.1 purine-nucleoside phosphorylase [Salinimicrobium tongyeongense]
MLKDLEHTTEFLEARGFDKPEIGIILGTGLGKLIDELEIISEVSYNHIPGFPTATVEFHKGKLIFGKLDDKKVVVMQGRFHIYEGYSLWDVTFPVRVMKRLGIKKLLISNAAGSVNPDFKKGDIMLIDDHINLQGGSPLAFRGVEQLGTRFTDMSAPYDQQSGRIMQEIAKENGFPLHKGVYAAVVGPQLETRAEYRYLRTIGADAVGMSTVPEVIVANHLKIPIAAVSVLTDEGNPDDLKPVNIQDIIETAGKAEPQMITLFRELIKRIELKPAE